MEIYKWIEDHYIIVMGIGVGMLFTTWIITILFKTYWGEWKYKVDTKPRKNMMKWNR